MTDAEKIAMVKAMSEETDDAVVSAYLALAKSKILRLLYPNDLTAAELPNAYGYTQVEAAVYLLNKRGAEGETTHKENGIDRVYEKADLPDSLVRQIVPFCKTVG